MDSSPLQFPLPLKLDAEASFENYWARSNRQVVDALQALSGAALDSEVAQSSDRASEEWLYLCGVQGSGKSHLLQAVVQQSDKNENGAMYLDCQELVAAYSEVLAGMEGQSEGLDEESLSHQLFAGYEHYTLLCFDNVQAFGVSLAWQKALFYLLVKLKTRQHSTIVFAANNTIDRLGLQLPDLISRLKNAAQYQLSNYSDEDKMHILMHRAGAAGIELAEEVARFIIERSSRDMPGLIREFRELDRMAMAKQRKLTIPFVKQTLAI